MKTLKMLSVAAVLVSGWMTSWAQAIEAEVPGDNFSLEGALELFKKSSSPEEFEKMLNSSDSKVNNLDLNGDGYTDYIRVHDRQKGNIHAFILQAVISENEVQDIAVIELEKLANGKAVLQIIGDEDIYGVTTIIEPTQEVRTYAGTQSSRTVVNVWAWPSVQYVYGPYYTTWVSPWGWYDHPVWWSHWTPIAYVHYHPIWRPYHRHYVVCHTRRVVHAYDIYRPYRRTSVIVHNRHNDRVVRYRTAYRDGYRRDDGRTYVRDDRSRTRNQVQRVDDGRRRTEDISRRYNTTSTPSQRSTTDRSTTRERTTVTRPQQDINKVRRSEPAQRSSREQEILRSESPAPAPAPTQRSRQTTAPTPQRTPAQEPNIRRESPQRPAEVNRTREVNQRTPDINQSRSTSPPAPTVHRAPETPREVRPSAPAPERRASPTPSVERIRSRN